MTSPNYLGRVVNVLEDAPTRVDVSSLLPEGQSSPGIVIWSKGGPVWNVERLKRPLHTTHAQLVLVLGLTETELTLDYLIFMYGCSKDIAENWAAYAPASDLVRASRLGVELGGRRRVAGLFNVRE